MFKNLLSLGLGLAVVLVPVQNAWAKMTTITKFTNPATGKTYVYFPMSPNGEIEVTASSAPVAKTFTADACGIIKIKSTATAHVTGFSGSGLSSSGSAGDDPPTCNAGVISYNLPVGMSVLTTGTYGPDYYARVSTSSGSFAVNVTYQKVFKVKGGECGLGRVTVSETKPMTSFNTNVQFGGLNGFQLANLPSTNAPDICRAPYSGAAKVLYSPQ